jgi:ketosteroid isomerase-like protein
VKKRNIVFGLLLIVCIIFSGLTVFGQQSSSKAVADEIIAIVKAQWAAENSNNFVEAGKNISPDYTEFNGDYATRLDGKELNMLLSEASGKDSGKVLASEMSNAKVQVYGDTAILTYNFVGITQDKDGKVAPNRAKSTRVYVKQGGKWMLVHSNFGVDPVNIR